MSSGLHGLMSGDLFSCREVVLAYSADGANPIFWNVFEGSARGNTIFWVTGYRVIDVATSVANILCHSFKMF